MKVGLIADVHGICGPMQLWEFVRGLDELWIAGHIGTKECLDNWKGLVRSVRYVVSDDGYDSKLEGSRILQFEVEGNFVMMAHKAFQGEKADYDFASKEFINELLKNIKKNTYPNIIVSGYSHEFVVRLDERFSRFRVPPFILLNPGAVTPISHNRCTALRFDVSADGVRNVEKFSAEAPVARGFDKQLREVTTFAFVDESVVSGQYYGFKNSK